MSEQSAAKPHAGNNPGARHDTPPRLELLFMREVETAPMPAPSTHALRGTEFGDDEDERDIYLGVDALLLRDAFLALGKKI